MKKNISINLFGTLYQIDEDAYSLLERYLDSMKSYFSRQDGGEEIADDIEHRVAELLWQQKQGGAEAVNIDDIKNIIKTIGNPADFEEEAGADGAEYAQEVKDENNNNEGKTYGNYDKKDYSQYESNVFDRFKQRVAGRRLYRDPYDKVLGGVCSGLSAYFNYGDPVMWRLAFVLLCFLLPFLGNIFTGITGLFGFTMTIISFPSIFMVPLLYLVLLVVVPQAITPEDRLRMQGKEVTPENIQEVLLNEASGKFGGSAYSSSYASSYTSGSYSGTKKSTATVDKGSEHIDGVYGSGTEGATEEAASTTDSAEADAAQESSDETKSAFTAQDSKEEQARRAKASYDQYMYYKKNRTSTGATIAKGCGIGCLAVILAPILFVLAIVLLMLVCVVLAAVCVPFGMFNGEINYEPFTEYSETVVFNHMPVEVFMSNHPWGVFVCALAALIFLCIPIYALVRRFKKDRQPLPINKRLTFIVVWIVSLAVTIISSTFLIYKYNKENLELMKEASDNYFKEKEKEWTIDGIKFHNENDYYYFRNNGWKMVEADCCDRYTYDGEYMNGDESVRYLDAYTEGNHVRYTAENTETLQPGTYRLVANCRAEYEKVYIFCYNDKYGKDKTIKYAEIPAYGNEGGNIWLSLVDSTYNSDKVVKALVNEFRNIPSTHIEDENRTITRGEEYANVNDGKGYGWSYVYIDDIVVKEPLTVKYGVTTLKDGKGDYHGWFSATDFRFVRISSN